MPRKLEGLAYNDSQCLDLYLVDQPDRPLVICLHGGGFISGDRNDERCKQSAALLTESGFNCATVSYALASSGNRFAKWPRNLFDVADAVTWLHDQATNHDYDFSHFGMLGFSAGCCLSNLYIQGGSNIFSHFGYTTPVFRADALVGFYGPYDFSSRQTQRRSDNIEINRYHSPSWWIRHQPGPIPPPVLHIQGDRDNVVLPDQHEAFKNDYEKRGYSFKALVVEEFGHSFTPRDTNTSGKSIDLRTDITNFFFQHLSDMQN